MNAEDRIRQLKQVPPLTKEEKRKKLMTAVMLSISTFISLLFLVYAFIQKQEADYQKEAAVKAQVIAEQNFKLAEEQRKLAQAAQVEAEHQHILAEQQHALALQALEDCKKG